MLKNKLLSIFFASFYLIYSDDAFSIVLKKPLSTCKKEGHVHFCGKGKEKGISQSDKENKAPIKVKKTPSSTPSVRKNKRTRDAAAFIDLTTPPPKRQKVLTGETTIQKTPIFAPLLTHSPTSAERKFFSPLRRELAKKEYADGNTTKQTPGSPMVRKTFSEVDSGNYFTPVVIVGKTVAQADFLFDPHAEALTDGKWKTNLERMKEGLCPIGHKGIVSKKEQTTLTGATVKKRQSPYRIELHHVTQKDTGKAEDPICEMTHVAHMGENARIILNFNSETEALEIVHSSLEKKEALELCDEDQFIVTNVLHFRKGDSFINRKEFNSWRIEYWKARAAEIEKGHFVGQESLSPHVICKKLFHTPNIE